jgi:hypothetical protein
MKDIQAIEASSPPKRLSSISKLNIFYYAAFLVIFALLDPDPGPADENQCGSMQVRIHNTALCSL